MTTRLVDKKISKELIIATQREVGQRSAITITLRSVVLRRGQIANTSIEGAIHNHDKCRLINAWAIVILILLLAKYLLSIAIYVATVAINRDAITLNVAVERRITIGIISIATLTLRHQSYHIYIK